MEIVRVRLKKILFIPSNIVIAWLKYPFYSLAQVPGFPVFVMQKLIGLNTVCKLLFVSIPQ